MNALRKTLLPGLFALTLLASLADPLTAADPLPTPGPLEPFYHVYFRQAGDARWQKYCTVGSLQLANQHRDFLWYHRYDVAVATVTPGAGQTVAYYNHAQNYYVYFARPGDARWSLYAVVNDRNTAVQHYNFLRYYNFLSTVSTTPIAGT